ncbi:hyaluronidase [Aphelenchoides avenae]|nr:hyaluronidase [Aphelenchus avenae]
MGCPAFALLFDDIETAMNEQDRKHFPSFVMAQLTVSNTVYEYLDGPLFFFCPTEYCESRAVPTLDESAYLNTLGEKLNPNIHIMWTGPRVVSRLLTVDHIRKVARVLHRKPLIWDNLHANDYDPKRVFLGPFAGRSVELKREVAGMLLNPNCRYEANFVPLRTLADWNQSDYDAPKVEDDENATLEAGLQKAAETAVERGKPFKLYHPLRSLRDALDDWVLHFAEGTGPPIPPISQIETHSLPPIVEPVAVNCAMPPPSIRTCEGNDLMPLTEIPPPLYTSPMGSATTVTVQAFPIGEAAMGVTEAHDPVVQTVNSLSVDYNEPMDGLSDGPKEDASPMETAADGSDVSMDEVRSDVADDDNKISTELLALFVDIFYLPFEYGERGLELLAEFQWLHENAQVVRRASSGDENRVSDTKEWTRRAADFRSASEKLTRLYLLVMESPNKSLVQEIFPYLWDAHAIISVLSAIISWMGKGNLLIAPIETGDWWNNAEVDVEPWALGGGLLSDLQKLIVASPNVADIFLCRNAVPLSLNCFVLRPAIIDDFDKQLVYDTMSTEAERNMVRLVTESRKDDLFFDRCFAQFFKYGIPPHSFIAEECDKHGSCEPFSAALGILNVPGMLEDFKSDFISQYKAKYTAVVQEEDAKSESERVRHLYDDVETWPLMRLSPDLFEKYNSMVEIRWSKCAPEGVSIRRLLLCISSTLSLNGSNGFFTCVVDTDREKMSVLSRLGLHRIEDIHVPGYCLLGHLL